MNLLDKYILAVGKNLPRKNRLDLQTEIRSTIEDMLEDRSQQSGRPVDEVLISEVLKEYGAPAKVAAAYQPARYLVGPRLYPFFEMVVKIVAAVLSVLALVGFMITFFSGAVSGEAFLAALGKYGLQLISGLIAAFGNIVLVFAILERVLPVSEFEDEAEKWEPADLNAEPDPDQVSRSEQIFEVIFTVLGLVVLNLYPNIIGIAMFKDESWIFVPGLSAAFYRYLPWINLLGVLGIVLALYLLRQGCWAMISRLFHLALDIAGIALALIMLLGPSLISFDSARLAETLGESSGVVTGLLNSIPLIVLGIIIIIESIEVVQAIWRLIGQRSAQKPFLPR